MKRIRAYLAALPEIFRYQLISKTVLFLIAAVFRQAAYLLIRSTGRAAVTSGDFLFLFTTWQGWLLLALGLLILCVYVVFDLCVKILYSREALCGGDAAIRRILREAFQKTGRLLTVRGILIVLYVSLLVPLVGVGLPVSLTENFQIPNFITSVIYATPLYLTAYLLGILALTLVGFYYLFTLHEILLDECEARTAMQRAGALMRSSWKSFLIQYIPYTMLVGLAAALLMFLAVYLPQGIVALLPVAETLQRYLAILISLFGLALSGCIALTTTPLLTLELTRLYLEFRDGQKREPVLANRKRFRGAWIVVVLLAVLGLIGIPITNNFDTVFPAESSTQVIAHRAGGTLAPENSIAGIYAAADHGAYAGEIDVQRTADGYYIINHDSSFQRLCGVDKTPMEMTLAEIRALTIAGSGEQVPTFEEMLDAAHGRLVLFVELKGKSADERMADDIAAIVKEKGMEEECVLISLSYPVLQYIEEKYPELETGYLYYASFGDVTALPMDDLILEEQPATAAAIQHIHASGKKVFVWTVNTEASMKHFLTSGADAIITDEVEMAERMKQELSGRSYLQRIWDTLLVQGN